MRASKDEPNLKVCACAARMADLLRANPAKGGRIRKAPCLARQKEYRANRETDYCFECESHPSTGAEVD